MPAFIARFLRNPSLLIVALLTGCVAVDGPPPGAGPGFCSREYAPVCARRGGDRQSFRNACEARRAGYRIVADGRCRSEAISDPRPSRPERPRPETPRPDRPRPETPRPERPQPQPEQPRPERPSPERPRPEQPEQERPRPQPEQSRPQPERPRPPQACTREYAPVCGSVGGGTRTFPNACEARAAGAQVVKQGAC